MTELPYYTINDVCRLLGGSERPCSRQTMYRYINTIGFPKPAKLGARRSVWPREAVDRWIEARLAA